MKTSTVALVSALAVLVLVARVTEARNVYSSGCLHLFQQCTESWECCGRRSACMEGECRMRPSYRCRVRKERCTTDRHCCGGLTCRSMPFPLHRGPPTKYCQ